MFQAVELTPTQENSPETQGDTIEQQLERLWKTDFGGSVVETKSCPSVEDKKALEIMEGSLKTVDGHYQVALPWRCYPPYLPNNKNMAEQRCQLLKRRLLKNKDLLANYQTTVGDYIGKGHAERVPDEEINPSNKPVWYLPHHPVVHRLKPDKVRVVYDCAAEYKRTSLNQQLLQGPDEANQLIDVLSRFRKERVAYLRVQVLMSVQEKDLKRNLLKELDFRSID